MTPGQGRGPLRFATFLAPNMLPVYRFLAERIAERLGRPVELVVGTSFDQFEQGRADLGVICGLPYVWLAERHPPPVEPLAAPVLAGDRYGGCPVYYSDVIVRHDSPITCLEELRGRSWAYNDPASHSGHTVTLYSLIRMGARPGFFGLFCCICGSGYARPGRLGHSPPRASMASPISAWGDLNPKAIRVSSRSRVLTDSTRALEAPCSRLATIGARWALTARATRTNAGMRQRRAQTSHASSNATPRTPRTLKTNRSSSLSR